MKIFCLIAGILYLIGAFYFAHRQNLYQEMIWIALAIISFMYAGFYKLEEQDVTKIDHSVCRCKGGKQGRTVDENFNQICDVCGGS